MKVDISKTHIRVCIKLYYVIRNDIYDFIVLVFMSDFRSISYC